MGLREVHHSLGNWVNCEIFTCRDTGDILISREKLGKIMINRLMLSLQPPLDGRNHPVCSSTFNWAFLMLPPPTYRSSLSALFVCRIWSQMYIDVYSSFHLARCQSTSFLRWRILSHLRSWRAVVLWTVHSLDALNFIWSTSLLIVAEWSKNMLIMLNRPASITRPFHIRRHLCRALFVLDVLSQVYCMRCLTLNFVPVITADLEVVIRLDIFYASVILFRVSDNDDRFGCFVLVPRPFTRLKWHW